ncbi:MAG: permease-like cell division protein FtsX [Desulfobacterales bacterium]
MRHLKRALQDFRRNRFLSLVTVITIALATLIVSAFALFFLNAEALLNSWKKGVHIMVYLKDGVLEPDVARLQKILRGLEGIEAAHYVSRAEALARLREQLPQQTFLLDNLRQNPLPDAFEVHLLPDARIAETIEKLAARIEILPEVEEVESGRSWLSRFTGIFNLFRLAGYALGALLLMAAVFFVANTIRLVLYTRREEIDVMRLVGAEESFIKTPFYIEGLLQGALGGAIGLTLCLLLFLALSSNVSPELFGGSFTIRFLPAGMLAAIVLISMMVGWLGCFASLKQFFD